MSKVVLISSDCVNESMAGPAIRYWEFAKALSATHEVLLSVPNQTKLTHERFKVSSRLENNLAEELKGATAIITQMLWPELCFFCKRQGIKIIIDAYCPYNLESLELSQKGLYQFAVKSIQFSFKMADFIICASEKQRDLWLGSLMNLQPLDKFHKKDPTLRNLIDVVPFGLSAEPLTLKQGKGPHEIFHLKDSDKIVLWGGSISDWFDPCTLIQAFSQIASKRSDIKLVFMGVTLPNPSLPKMKKAQEAIDLAKSLNLLDHTVFFNYGWLPYEERQHFLHEACIGVSTHSKHIETDFSFRTRMLDYIWAGLPIISTEGDTFAQLISQKELGVVVPYYDSEFLAESIMQIVGNQAIAEKYKTNIERIKSEFHWNQVIKPINTILESPEFKIRSTPRWLFLTNIKYKIAIILLQISAFYKEGGLWLVLKKICQKLFKKNAR